MREVLSSLVFLFLIGCETSTISGPEQKIPVWELPVTVELDTRLEMDGNGFYHLDIDEENWQTLHRLSGTAYLYDEPLEVLKVHWQSSHYWYLGDTLGYIVNRYLTDEGIYVSVDTSYVIGFDGMEVPTVNFSSYSNASGEVNTMFAPVQSMEGDTVTIRMYFWSEWDFIYEEEVFFIVLD